MINLTIELPELTQDWGQTLGGHKQNLVCTRTQEKGAVTLQETDPDLPVSVQESVVACCRAGGSECSSACMGPLFYFIFFNFKIFNSYMYSQT